MTLTVWIHLTCMECGKTFKRKWRPLFDVECPKCHGVDVEVT